ncbi:MAG: hypothetical protein ACP5SD_02355 [Elusimicrobiales bacterium]|nr:hypothetical protein [Elusimicrobiales bacterium]
MKRFFLVCFFMISCATTKKYEAKISSWIGSDINELISVWGSPSNESNMPNGNRVYTWLWVGKALIGPKEYESTVKKLAFEGSGINWCRTSFVSDKNFKILNYSFDGSYCKSR